MKALHKHPDLSANMNSATALQEKAVMLNYKVKKKRKLTVSAAF